MISQTTIQAVKDLDLITVINRYVTLTKKGANHVGLSPFNDEKTPSFSVNPAKGLWKCFSSGQGGKTPESFLMAKEGLTWIEAVLRLAQDNSIPVEYENWDVQKKEAYQKAQKEKKETIQLLEWALAYFSSQDVPATWLKKRGFNKEDVKRFQLGYAPIGKTDTDREDWTLLKEAATKAGFTVELLIKSGLCRQSSKDSARVYDVFRNRIIMPVFDEYGNIIAFTGRLDDSQEVIEGKAQPKYLHTPGFEQGKHLYGLQLAKSLIQKQEKAYLVEGNPDVIRLVKHELPGIAPCGSSLTDHHCKLIKRYTDTVCIIPDFDPKADTQGNITAIPGIDALHRNAQLLLKHDIHVKCLIPGK